MQFLIIFLSVIAGIVVFFLFIALFVKKDFRVERSVVINKPKDEVFNYVKFIRNQEQYSVWVMRDPNVKLLYAGEDGKVGFTSSWTSEDKHVGVGAQEIIEMNADSMKVELRFKVPFEDTNYATTSVEAIGANQTKLYSVFTGTQNYPKNIMCLFIDKLIGKDMQANLDNVKKNLEG